MTIPTAKIVVGFDALDNFFHEAHPRVVGSGVLVGSSVGSRRRLDLGLEHNAISKPFWAFLSQPLFESWLLPKYWPRPLARDTGDGDDDDHHYHSTSMCCFRTHGRRQRNVWSG